jgi:HPt (histidine-containing phosphotransfer) domain-containing protein
MNNKTLYIKLLTSFKGRELVDGIINAINNNDKEEVSKNVHNLKGVSANLAIVALADVSVQIEASLKSDEALDSFVPVLLEKLEKVEAEIKKIISEE